MIIIFNQLNIICFPIAVDKSQYKITLTVNEGLINKLSLVDSPMDILYLGCPPWKYGDNCSLVCPDNCNTYYCDIVNGTCDSCIDGFEGKMCNQCKLILKRSFIIQITNVKKILRIMVCFKLHFKEKYLLSNIRAKT